MLEVADENVARQLLVSDAGKIARADEVLARAFVFGDQHAFPEEIDETMPTAELAYRFLKGRHPAAAHAEDLEEVVVEGLGFALFVSIVRPFTREFGSANAKFIGAQQVFGPGIPKLRLVAVIHRHNATSRNRAYA